MQIQQWWQQATEQLKQAGSDSAKLDAELLLCLVLERSRGWLYGFADHDLNTTQQQQLAALLARRVAGEPMAYITGQREFLSLALATDPSTLIPRPDTETLVEWALSLALPSNARVLDLGTGSGAIALALASENPSWQLQGVDVQPQAVALAQKNARQNALSQVQFFQSNWFAQVHGRFALIVSNPPYIDAQDSHLQQGDVRFEPRSALVAEQQGLADLSHIIQQAGNYLQDDGWLLLEHGYQQAPAVRALLEHYGFTAVASREDLAGQPRISGGQWKRA